MAEVDIFLSPHPDDLVYSAFSLLSDRSRDRMIVTLFNVSRFTRFGLRPRSLVTPLRTLEDLVAMWTLGCLPHYRFLDDSNARGEGPPPQFGLDLGSTYPARIVAPLGVGGNTDHLATREKAITLKLRFPKSRLVLFEDMPYASRSPGLDGEERNILTTLPFAFAPVYHQLGPAGITRKVNTSRLYLSQNDKAREIVAHAAKVGALSGGGWAERFFEKD